MRKFGTTVLAGLMALVALPALAGEKSCSCIVSASGSPTVGKIVASNGSVFLSGADGLVPAKPGMEVIAGSFLTVGFDANARISAGTACKLDIGENSIVSLIPENEERICLSVSELQAGNRPVTTTTLESKSVVNSQVFDSGQGFFDGPIPLFIIGGLGILGIATDDGMPPPASN